MAQRLLEEDASTLTHLLARLNSDGVRASCTAPSGSAPPHTAPD